MNISKNISERCVLCLDEKRSPVSIPCGHSFCVDCLNVYKAYKDYPWGNKCPICREDMKENIQPENVDWPGNANSHISATSLPRASQNTSHASLTSATSQQNNSLEEFISMAANYFDDGRDENDFYHDSYDNLDYSAANSTQSDDSFLQQSTQVDNENSYQGEDILTDSEEYNDNYDDYYDNDGDDYNSYEDDNYHDNEYIYDDEERSFLNVDDDTVTYEIDNEDVDWETVIDSDVIFIE